MNPAMDQMQTIPVATSPARMLWAAVAFLGVAVVAMGATLVHIQTQTRAPGIPMLSGAGAETISNAPGSASTLANPTVPSVAINNHVTPGMSVATQPARNGAAGNVETRVASRRADRQAPVRLNSDMPPTAPTIAVAPAATVAMPVPPAQVSEPTYPGYPPVASTPPVPMQAPVTQAPSLCSTCGTVESVTPVQRSAKASGTGAVAGGVLGAVVGNQIGKGSGRTVGTILSAVGGGIAGNAVERQMKKETVYQVQVRMEDGSLRTIEQASAPAVGSRIMVDGGAAQAGAVHPASPYPSGSSVGGAITEGADQRG